MDVYSFFLSESTSASNSLSHVRNVALLVRSEKRSHKDDMASVCQVARSIVRIDMEERTDDHLQSSRVFVV